MHASILQLLSLRDGQTVAAGIAEHVESCAQCTAELARLKDLSDRMRALQSHGASDSHAAHGMWARIEPLLTPATRLPPSTNRYLAVAAAVVWTAVAFVWFGVADHESPVAMQTSVVPQATPPAVETLLLESQDLESVLLDLPRRPHVELAATAATLDALEGQIQWLDYTLSRVNEDGIPHDQAAELWQERVDLLASLVTLRYAQASRTAF